MLLAIDIGNTNTVFSLFKGDEMVNSWRCKTLASSPCDEYASFLSPLLTLDNLGWHEINHVLVSSVVPDANIHVERFCRKYIKCQPQFVTPEICGLEIDLTTPTEIGADRLVNAVAASTHYSLPAIIVDFGTATTFDVVDEGGIYRGGVIAPGVRLSISALASQTAKLSQVMVEKPDKIIGKSTKEAMQSGMYWGYIGLINEIIGKIKTEMGKSPVVIATGGLAPLYTENTDIIDHVDENLISKGLLEIYKKTKE